MLESEVERNGLEGSNVAKCRRFVRDPTGLELGRASRDTPQLPMYFVEHNASFKLASGVENANHWLELRNAASCSRNFDRVRRAADHSGKHRMVDSAAWVACCGLGSATKKK
jgi:hypothetical protein